MHFSSFLVGPQQTPKSVRFLIWVIVITSILSPIATFVFDTYLHMSGPLQWFALSYWGLKLGWAWQVLTYSFIHSAHVGISLSLLISLFFHMLVLWFTGSEIAFRFGSRAFLCFYFGGVICVGMIASALMFLFSSASLLVGSAPPVYALMLVWAMLYPDLELYFFVLLRIKAKWLVALFLGMSVMINLSYGQFIPLLADLCGIGWGFLIGRIVWHLPNPYPLNLVFPKKKKSNRAGKIIDISVAQENDEAFMDRMLDKIARHGKESLTPRERKRMHKISEKKSRE